MTTKAQSSMGTIGSLLLSLILISGASFLMVTYIGGVGTNYGVSVNETRYELLGQDQITNLTSQMSEQFVNEEGQQNEDTDIISIMITNAYGMVKLFFNIPGLYSNLITGALDSIGVSPGVSKVIIWMVTSTIILLILFAAYEAVMKVRS